MAAVEVSTGPGKTEPAIAWVGKCPSFEKSAIYITRQSSLVPTADGLADLCAGAVRFGLSEFKDDDARKPVRLIPSDRVPTFMCAISAASVGGFPEPAPQVSCFGFARGQVNVGIAPNEYLLAAFQSNPILPSGIRVVFTREKIVFTRLIRNPNSILEATEPVAVRAFEAGEEESTAGFSPDLLSDEGFGAPDGFLEVLQDVPGKAQFRRYSSDGKVFRDNAIFTLTANGVSPANKLSFGETGTVPVSTLLGFEGGRPTGRQRVVIISPRSKDGLGAPATLNYPVDLTSRTQLESLGANSGTLERFAFAPSADLKSGAVLVMLRGLVTGGETEISALVKLGSNQLANATTDNAVLVPEKLPVLPKSYGMALGTSGTGTKATASGYLAVRTVDAFKWTDRCERGVVAAFPVSLK